MENLQKDIEILVKLYKLKKLDRALLLAKSLLRKNSKVVLLYNLTGLILAERRENDRAISYYEKGLKIDPKYATIYNNLASVYKVIGDTSKAEKLFKKSIELDNRLPETQNNLGNLYHFLNKHEEAMASYKKAVEINSKFYPSHYNLGVVFKNIGKFEDAKKHLKIAIELNPNFYSAHRTLSQLIKYNKHSEHLATLTKIYEDTKINKSFKKELVFSLAKAHEDIKDFDKSFKYLTEANDLHRKKINFSIDDVKQEFTEIKKIFNKNILSKSQIKSNQSSSPIFIIGMPRSGTTLVEQILSNHPTVYGGDELNFIPDLIEKNYSKSEPGSKKIIYIDQKKFTKISSDYIKKLNEISNNSERVTDKLPINFKWVGLIHMILPKAKIIHCVRNPADNCISIYKNFFTNRDLNFAYDLKEIVGFYNLYNDLMKYWHKLLPSSIFDIKYENLINNPEMEIKKLLLSCNLSWSDSCLKFYENKRPIKTASDTQARQKIYKTSVNFWKNYEKDVSKIFKKLS